MILSGKSIRNHVLNSDGVDVTPVPDEEQIQPASLDVRLGREKYVFEKDQRIKGPQHRFQPGKRYLCHTQESVSLPNDFAAQLAGRSSIGRQGIIVHKTAGWIDPGFEGEITLEMMNLGDEPVDLRVGDRVAQLVFFKLDQPSEGYSGSYQNQSGATEVRQ